VSELNPQPLPPRIESDHREQFERRVQALRELVVQFGSVDDFDEWIPFIWRKGFTTPAVLGMLGALLDGAESSIRTAQGLRESLSEGVRGIVEESGLPD